MGLTSALEGGELCCNGSLLKSSSFCTRHFEQQADLLADSKMRRNLGSLIRILLRRLCKKYSYSRIGITGSVYVLLIRFHHVV